MALVALTFQTYLWKLADFIDNIIFVLKKQIKKNWYNYEYKLMDDLDHHLFERFHLYLVYLFGEKHSWCFVLVVSLYLVISSMP